MTQAVTIGGIARCAVVAVETIHNTTNIDGITRRARIEPGIIIELMIARLLRSRGTTVPDQLNTAVDFCCVMVNRCLVMAARCCSVYTGLLVICG